MKFIQTPDAPLPAGHYSQAVVHNGVVYVAGLLPIDAATGEKQQGAIEAQTELVLKNLAAILKAAESNINLVLKTTIYVTDINLWGKVNEVYARVMGAHRPARTVVPVKELHYGFLIELDAVAAVRE
jgi:2-iminobutanoate/2-iminopropanoate deaminase